jgi:hypothetical protein
VTIEPSLTSQVDLCNIETDTSLSNVEVTTEPPLTSSTPTCIDINGFDIHHMRRTNIIRVHDVSILCRHSIRSRDVILKVDNVSIENWTFSSLNDYLSNNVITSIETQSYEDYNLNLQYQVHSTLMTPTSVSNSHSTTYANDINQSLSTTSGNFF